jgi:hypothetical protein
MVEAENVNFEVNEFNDDTEADTRPTITHEQFLELEELRKHQDSLGNVGYQSMKRREELRNRLAQEEQVIAAVEQQLEEVKNRLQEKYDSVITPLGLVGDVSISPTVPHYVSVIPQQQAAAPVE